MKKIIYIMMLLLLSNVVLSISFVPNYVDVFHGTVTEPDINYTHTLNEGSWNLTEDTTTPGFDMIFYINVTSSITKINAKIWYNGNSSHNIYTYLFNYTNNETVQIFKIEDSTSYENYNYNVPNCVDFIKDDIMKLIINHTSSGIATNKLNIDLIEAYSPGSIVVGDFDINIDFNNFMTVGNSEEIKLYAYLYDERITSNSTYTGFLTMNGIEYEMNFDDNLDVFNINVSSVIEENQDFQISLRDQPCNFHIYDFENDTMKWRIPFYIDLYLWKKNGNDTTTIPYKNEFAYIYLKNWNTSFTNEIKDISYLDEMFSWVPLYGSIGSTKLPQVINYDEVFWAPYSNGKAKIKLYESGNYSMYILTQDIVSNITWSYEFIRPQTGYENYKGEVTDKMNPLNIMSEEDQTFDIYFSMWEVNKMDILWDFGKWLILIVIWIVLIIVVVNFPGGTRAAPVVAISYWALLKLLGWI